MQMFLKLILLVLCTTNYTKAEPKTRQEILAQLLKNYDRDVYPNDREGNQTSVKVQLTIIDIDQVNDQREEIEMSVFLRMAWYDPRLQFENETDITFSFIELTGETAKTVWMPDLYITDERNAQTHGIMGQEKVIYIYQDGYIYFSERVTMTIECIMNFEEFPFDTQECTLQIVSYAYTTRSMILEWAPNPVQSLDRHTPYFKLEDNIKNSSGIMIMSTSLYREIRYFSYLNATLTMERNTSVYWFLYFVMYPIYACMVLISFGLQDTGSRVTACSSAIVAVAIQWIAVFGTLPSIPHFSVIDKWMILAILYHTVIHLSINIQEGQRSRFNEHSKISQLANEGFNQSGGSSVGSSTPTVSSSTSTVSSSTSTVSSSTSTVSSSTPTVSSSTPTVNSSTPTVIEWTFTFKKEATATEITAETEMTIKRSFKDFRILDEYLKMMNKNKLSVWEKCNKNNEDFIGEMMKELQPAKINQKCTESNGEKLKVMQSFIADGTWKCPTLFKILAKIKICLPSCRCCPNIYKCWKGCVSCCKKYCCCCCSSSCSNACLGRCSCCKVVLLKHLPDGSVTRVKAKDNLINRSVEDFYYLQTYLQAKYPEFKWPRIPLHNALTINDQRNITKMREDYISDMLRLLQPNSWRHHSEIEQVMQTFIDEDEWKGSKWYSCYRRYIVSVVDSAGQKTGPDLIAFIAFLAGYSLFVPFLLYDKSESGKYLFYEIIIPSSAIIISVIYAKYRSMRPPTLWHTNAQVERNTNRNGHQHNIVTESQIDEEHPNVFAMHVITTATGTSNVTDRTRLMDSETENYQST